MERAERKHKSIKIHLALLFSMSLSVSLFSQPASSEVIKFDSLIQDEPRIKFSKGVEEAVAPTTGALTVKATAVTLKGKGLPLVITHSYNSSAVQSLIEEEIGTGTLSKFAWMMGMGGKNEDFYGGCFHTQFGLRNASDIISEGLLKDIAVTVVYVIVKVVALGTTVLDWVGDLVKSLLSIVNIDFIDNNNLRTYVAPMTPAVGEVKGLISTSKKVVDFGEIAARITAFINLASMGNPSPDQKKLLDNVKSAPDIFRQLQEIGKASALQDMFMKYLVESSTDSAIDQPSIVMADGSTIGFKKLEASGSQNTYNYIIKQPDMSGQYNLVANKENSKFVYYFQMKDGKRYRIQASEHVFYYFGTDFDLSSVAKSVDLANIPQMLLNLGTLFANLVKIYSIPYGVLDQIEDTSGNTIAVQYDIVNEAPRRISKVIDSLGRETIFEYNNTDFNAASQPFYDLKSIIKPDGSKINYTYSGGAGNVCPEYMNLSDALGRTTTFHFKKRGDNKGRNDLVIGTDLPYFFMDRIDYPTGGYVYYDSRPVIDGDKYFYHDRNLTEDVVWKREEHTSTIPARDTVETTTFDYKFDVRDAQIVTSQFSFDVKRLLLDVAGMVADIITGKFSIPSFGGVYIRNVKEVTGGTITVKDAAGKITKYTLTKSTPGNFNHYVATLSLTSGVWAFDYLTGGAKWNVGYKPARIQVMKIDEAGAGCENITTVNTYNNKWFLTAKTVQQGAIASAYSYDYDYWANVVRETGPMGWEVNTVYGLNPQVVTNTVDGEAFVTESTGDANWMHYINRQALQFLPGLVTEKRTKNIDGNSNVSEQIVRYEYDNNTAPYRGLMTKQTVWPNGDTQVTSYTYTSWGEVSNVTDPMNNLSRMIYNYRTNEKDVISNYSVSYNTKIAQNGVVINEEITNTTVVNYSNEYLLREIDAKGNITSYKNDEIGRVTNVTFPDATIMTYGYHDSSAEYKADWIYVIVKDQEQIKTPGENYLRYGYDGLGRLKYLEQHFMDNGTNAVYRSENFYTSFGALGYVRDAQKRETHLSYDTYRRLIAIKYPDTNELRTSYDYSLNDGYIQKLIDANSNTMKYRFDVRGRLIAVTEPPTLNAKLANSLPQEHTTTYTYDLIGNLLSFKDANNNSTSYEYDSLNRLKKEIYPDSSHFDYTYDNLNNIVKKIDARGWEIFYNYDGSKKLTNIISKQSFFSPTRNEAFFVYDVLGNRTFASNENCNSSYSYNNRNWLMTESRVIDTIEYTFTYSYDSIGSVLTNQYPSGYRVIYQHDTLNRVQKIKYYDKNDSSIKDAVAYAYNPMGTIALISNANNVMQAFSYDLRDRVSEFIIYRKADGPDKPIVWTKYKYDAIGNRLQENVWESENRGSMSAYMAKRNIISKDELGVKQTYEYDNLYRLTGVNYPKTKQAPQLYSYDPCGNRMKHSFELGVHDFTNNNLNQLIEMHVNNGAGKRTYQYDLNGSMVKEEVFKGREVVSRKSLQLNYDNRIITVGVEVFEKGSAKSNGIIDMVRDADGNRIVKRVSYGTNVSSMRAYVGGEEYLVANSGLSLAVSLDRVYIGSLCLRLPSNGHLPVVEYMHKDVLGSTILITDKDAKTLERTRYDTFGNIERQQTTIDNRKLFVGKEFDIELGNAIHFEPRFYDPVVGRWLIRDKKHGVANFPKLLNRYTYCINNPVTILDKDGNDPFEWLLDLFRPAPRIPTNQKELFEESMRVAAKEAIRIGTSPDTGQLVLEVVGVIPVAGEFADGANAVIYVMRGKYGDAALSALCIVPIVGDVAGKGGKVAKKVHQVYLVYDKSGEVVYVGRTSQDLTKRFKQHLKDPDKAKAFKEIVTKHAGLTIDEARKIEQQLINQHGGIVDDKLMNKINSIAEKYWKEMEIDPPKQ